MIFELILPSPDHYVFRCLKTGLVSFIKTLLCFTVVHMLSPTTVVVVMLGVFQSASSPLEDNIGELYFTIPDEAKNFDDAVSSCKSNYNSTLAVVNNTYTQTALMEFLDAKIMTPKPTMYINIRLNKESADTWFLMKSSYNGYIGNLNPPSSWRNRYLLYCHLQNFPDGDRIHYLVWASTPGESRNYICQYNESRCFSDSARNIVYMGKCYVKYENESLTWYQAKERCVNSGGDLATFQSDPSDKWLSPAQFNTSWLSNSSTYWVGIRYKNWSWKYTYEDNQEAIFTSWSTGKPNNYSFECVCVDPKGSPSWSWTDCDCTTPRPFVCLKIVPTTSTETTSTTSVTGVRHSTTSMILVDANHSSSSNGKEALIVGLVLGIGVILPLLVIILLLVVVIIRQRRQLREKSSSNEGVNHFAKATSAMEANGSAEAAASDAHYQHLKRGERPGTQMPLYDQLDQTQAQEYEPIS